MARQPVTGTDGHCLLAATVIKNAWLAALDGDESAELWLRESNRIGIFAAGLGIDHGQLIRKLESRQRQRRKAKNARRKM